MTRLRRFVVALWLASLASFLLVNLGNVLLVEALLTQGLAVILLGSVLPIGRDRRWQRQWFAFAVGLYAGLMGLSLTLLVLGAGTEIEKTLALALTIAGVATLVVALREIDRARRGTAAPGADRYRSGGRRHARRRIDPYFFEGRSLPVRPARSATHASRITR